MPAGDPRDVSAGPGGRGAPADGNQPAHRQDHAVRRVASAVQIRISPRGRNGRNTPLPRVGFAAIDAGTVARIVPAVAGARLHIVQSGLSASIRSLEDELGAVLFIRTTRHVELTSTGRAFPAEARRVLAATLAARLKVERLQARPPQGPITLIAATEEGTVMA